MGRLGPTEILVIIAIVVLLFGGRRIAEIGKGLGEGIRNFKKGISEPGKSAIAGELPGGTEKPPAPTTDKA
jgi:sec-independent protein translocase protein TatA